MGFDPQTAGKPLVNPRRWTTKVNLVIVLGVIVFLVIGLIYGGRTAVKSDRGEAVGGPAVSDR